MPGGKRLVVGLGGKQRVHGVHRGRDRGRVLQQVQEFLEGPGLAVLGAQGGADGGEAVAVFREDGVVLV